MPRIGGRWSSLTVTILTVNSSPHGLSMANHQWCIAILSSVVSSSTATVEFLITRWKEDAAPVAKQASNAVSPLSHSTSTTTSIPSMSGSTYVGWLAGWFWGRLAEVCPSTAQRSSTESTEPKNSGEVIAWNQRRAEQQLGCWKKNTVVEPIFINLAGLPNEKSENYNQTAYGLYIDRTFAAEFESLWFARTAFHSPGFLFQTRSISRTLRAFSVASFKW